MLSRLASFGRHSPARGALFLILLAGPALSQAQAILAKEVIEPRTFGYVLGDKIRREVHLTVHPDYRLDEESLPEAGRLDRWLEIADAEVHSETDRRGRHYRLVFTYQLRNAPAAPETVAIPQQNLRLLGEMQAVTTLVPTLRVTVAPLTWAVGADRITGSSLQQDRPPAPLPVRERQRRLAWTGAALLVLLLFAAWRRGFRSFMARENLPFARAVRELKRLQPAPEAPAQYRAGLKVVHDAINRTAGRAVFAHNLDEFFASHPEFAPLRDEFDLLFAASGRLFFAHTAAGAPAAGASPALLRLCQLCRRIERRSFEVSSPGKLHAAGC
jgi:mxaA protein